MEYVFSGLIVAVFILVVSVIALAWQSYCHNETLKQHQRIARLFARRNANKNEALQNIESDVNAILHETKGFARFCKYTCWVIIPFCLIASIHHLFVYFPRILNPSTIEQGQSGYAHLGVDYLGIIVALFAIIVTILVTWQIYSTIRAKEELRETQKEIKESFEKRLKELENKVEKLNNRNSKTDGIEEAKEQIHEAISLALPKDLLDRVDFDIAKKSTELYKWLWRVIDETKTNGQILDEYKSVKNKRPRKVAFVNGREATDAEVIELINEIRPIRIMILTAINKPKQSPKKDKDGTDGSIITP
ncbi:MAG: DUF2730 domain-containing protein [Muribaculaceae bacterium]|jgi:hypothetical protein